ncbi:MAG: hypothetical protein A2064_00265 [Spirochaetes bacterium GWB1_66_5]|nr:MAG: hypothetical protein A2064_00265 [Spirochaetes bacterium GWB1_66_5]
MRPRLVLKTSAEVSGIRESCQLAVRVLGEVRGALAAGVSTAELDRLAAARIREAGGIVFYHGNEKSIPHLALMAGLGFDAINVGEGVDIGEVKRAIGGQVCIMGNLDPLHDLQPRSSQEVGEVVREIVETAKPGGGYLFCTGEGVPHNTPVENLQAMHRAVRTYGKY